MYEIVIKGKSGEIFPENVNINKLDGIDCQDEFVEYFDGDTKGKLESGYMDFKVENNELWTITTYTSNEELTEDELKELGDYTQGQWSDGIGEGFEQQPCSYTDDDEEIFISPWSMGQELIIEQNIND
jgi:hypothetical protein